MLILVLALLFTPASLAADVVATLTADAKASTLVHLITTAGLTSSLSSGGDVTIFAPTDAAFAKLPSADLVALMANPSKVADLLKYHVVSGVMKSTDIIDDLQVTTLSGDKVRLNVYSHENTITADGAKIISADNAADNGVIHFIDHVIMPRTKTIDELLSLDPEFSEFVKAIATAGIESDFQHDNLTLFAPTNDAFAKLPRSDLALLMGNVIKMTELLQYHIIPHTLYSAGIWNHEYEFSVDGHRDRIHIRKDINDGIMINNAWLTTHDIQASNGVIHKIDHVLIPVRVGFWLRTGKVGK